jgi:peptidoglycan/LPS O-acetylase OafA/YrhL
MVVLDGSRGVAALVVMMTHGFWTAELVPTGAFSVDYFLILSGLVIAYAYGDRIRSGAMTVGQFYRARFVRLYPMIALGMVSGAILYVLGEWLFANHLPIVRTLTAAFAGLLLVPLAPGYLSPSLVFTFPLNAPAWSLFFELIANLLYAPLARYITRPRVFAITAVFAAGFVFALWRHRLSSFGLILHDIPDGFVRLLFTFSAGLVLFRLINPRLRFSTLWLPALALVYLAVCSIHAPWTSGTTRAVWIMAAIGVMPGMVFVMAHMEPGPRLTSICNYLGRLSYPLYLTHYPVVSFFNKLITHLHPDRPSLVVLVVIQMTTAIAAAAAVLHVFDEPARAWLSKHLMPSRTNLAEERP